MKPKFFAILLAVGVLCVAFAASAQPPGGKGGKDGGKGGKGGKGGESKAGDVDSFVARLMAFNAKKDGKLTKDELTDERLHPLFDRADANMDGAVTKEELAALYEKESAALGGGRGGPDDGGPGGKGPGGKGKGPGGKGPGGPGGRGPGGPSDGGPPGPGGGPPQPGQILPDFLQERLQLTDVQKKQVADLQKEIDAKLATILTDEQRNQLKELRDRGPGGPGGPPGDRRRPGDRPGS